MNTTSEAVLAYCYTVIPLFSMYRTAIENTALKKELNYKM